MKRKKRYILGTGLLYWYPDFFELKKELRLVGLHKPFKAEMIKLKICPSVKQVRLIAEEL